MSTSGAQSGRSSREASEVPAQVRPLRSLAPKPSIISARPSQNRGLVVPSSLPYRASRPPICLICSRRGCQLNTHKALISRIQRSRSTASTEEGAGSLPSSHIERMRQSAYTKSYAYYYAQMYVDADMASSRVDPFFDLPLPIEINNAEMHMLFHKYFTVESNRIINLPRPPELASDTVSSPFFLPAMTDSALCLAILAASAALLPQRSGRPAENVAVLTLFDQAMYQLRERLSSGSGEVSDATVAAATFLWGINALLSDADSMQLHGKSVHALVSGRGGLSNLGLCGAVARLVVMMDNLNAVIFAEQAFYPNTGDAAPLEDAPAPVCGAYFNSKRSQQNISPAVDKLCFESVGIANLLEKMIRDRSTSPEYFHAITKISSIGTDTVNTYVEVKETGSKDECVCLTVQLTNTLLYHRPREQQMMVTTQAGRLIRAMQKQEILAYWLEDMELLVWIFFVLAMIPHDFDGKEWAMDLLCQALCSKFGPAEWPDDWQETVHRVVLNFVWCDARLGTEFVTICRNVEVRVFGGNEDDDEG